MYILQPIQVNGFPYWKHYSSDKAMWFYDGWMVGYDKNIKTVKCGIAGPRGIEEWPNNISSKWIFSNRPGWQEAANCDIVFEDCSSKGEYSFIHKNL